MRESMVLTTSKLLTATCCLVAVRYIIYRPALFHTLCPRESRIRAGNRCAFFVYSSSHTSTKIAPSEAHFHVTEITGEQATVHTGDKVGRLQDRFAFRAAHFFFLSFLFFHQQLAKHPPTHACKTATLTFTLQEDTLTSTAFSVHEMTPYSTDTKRPWTRRMAGIQNRTRNIINKRSCTSASCLCCHSTPSSRSPLVEREDYARMSLFSLHLETRRVKTGWQQGCMDRESQSTRTSQLRASTQGARSGAGHGKTNATLCNFQDRTVTV